MGRGSRGRAWETGEGNLFASLLLMLDPNEVPVSTMAGLTFVASLSLLSAINNIQNDFEAAVSLKWPNDVLVNDKKCAGILLETHQLEDRTAVIIGFGVNCTWSPLNANFPATNLQEEGFLVTSDALFLLLREAMHTTLSTWNNGREFRQIRENWLANAYNLGKTTTIKIPGQPDRTGIFKTIDEQGLFVLQTDNGEEVKISTADIFPSA